ncbi:sulfatase [Olivibacter sp. SDN3]|uniref:sulfatase family protein n=1 Tax=Olivibacter sp. SDN3 TaxID=2764720 RepID=UPI0016518CFD|nr:sulfatase [Olivibacter sp. SDN3]QNL48178.1 sulfatase [Olivibacter sp. SDN3]
MFDFHNFFRFRLIGIYLFTILCLPSVLFAQNKPNIIFLLTDDHRWDALGHAGNQQIATPVLDSLASQGVYFERAYVTTSICCVSRASLLSGQYASRHQINDFQTDMDTPAVEATYPILLKNAGYKIGFIGKYGVGTQPPEKLYDYWSCTNEGQPDYFLSREDGIMIHHTDSVANDIAAFLGRFASQGPFCLSVSFKAPHELDGDPPSYPVQQRYADLYRDTYIPKPLTADPVYWESMPDFFQTEENIGRKRWRDLFSSDRLYQENTKNYYRLVTGVDEVVGQMMSQLKALGIAENTLIIFMGDNGFMMGEHGLEGKWFGFEESIRVPLLISAPFLSAELRGKSSEMALNIDIAPTILAAAGIEIPRQMQGINLVDMLKGKAPARTSFFYEHTFLGSPQLPRVEGVVTKDLKYIQYIEHGFEELYDLRADPFETKNLAHEPGESERLSDMRSAYAKWKEEVK